MGGGGKVGGGERGRPVHEAEVWVMHSSSRSLCAFQWLSHVVVTLV